MDWLSHRNILVKAGCCGASQEGKIMIISVRRAHENERNAYYEQQ